MINGMKIPMVTKIPKETKIVLVVIIGIVLPSIALTFFAFNAVGGERLKAYNRQAEQIKTLLNSLAQGPNGTLGRSYL